MGKRGPARTPTAELEKRGSWRANVRKKQGEVVLPVARPEFPAWGNEAVREIFDMYADMLVAAGACANIDGSVVYTLSSAAWKKREADAIVEAEGVLSVGEKGTRFFHPAAAVSSSCDGVMMKCYAQLGLTPAARSGLPMKPAAAPDNVKQSARRFLK